MRYFRYSSDVSIHFVPLENFPFIWLRHYYRDLIYPALMAIEQSGFFNVAHLLWHGPTLYNGHLRGPVTLTPVAERLAVELSLPVLKTKVCPNRGSNTNLPHAGWKLCHYATGAICYSYFCKNERRKACCNMVLRFNVFQHGSVPN